MEDRVHLLGIRHHGPGSAALLRQALDAIDPQCVLIEGPPEADDLMRYVRDPAMRPPVALLLHSIDDANCAFFMPFAEFSPEWQAMQWAVARGRNVKFIDWPAGVSLASSQDSQAEPSKLEGSADPLDLMAEAAGYSDGEAFWNALIEQYGGDSQHAVSIFTAIESAMTEARGYEDEAPGLDATKELRQVRREAFMRINIRQALKNHEGKIVVVCGAWHLSGLRAPAKPADDKALV